MSQTALADRDQQTLADLVQCERPMLRRFVSERSRFTQESEDLVQEVLLIALRRLQDGAYDPSKGTMHTWLFGIARRHVLSANRTLQRRCRFQCRSFDRPSEGVDALVDERAVDQEGEDRARQKELFESALRALRRSMAPKAFKSFRLYALKQRPAQQVAAEVGISPTSVYVYKSRVLQAVRDWIDQSAH